MQDSNYNCKNCSQQQICFRISPVHSKALASVFFYNYIQVVRIYICHSTRIPIPLLDFLRCPFSFT